MTVRKPTRRCHPPMVERNRVWRCIGCGRIDGPAPCIGVCEDRPAEVVDAADYDRLALDLVRARQRAAALEDFLRRLAGTRPRSGDWERSYAAFQRQARRLLDQSASLRDDSIPPADVV